MTPRRDNLNHGDFARYSNTHLPTLLRKPGPVANLIDGYFPDDFVAAIKLRRGTKSWALEIEYGVHKITRAVKQLPVLMNGSVKVGWAARLKRALKDLYPLYLEWCGGVEGEPPASSICRPG